DLYASEKVAVEALWAESQNENTTKERKKQIIEELNKISPEYFGGIKTEKQLHEEGIEAIERYVKSLEIKARAQAAQELYVEALKESMKQERQTLKENSDTWARWGGAILEHVGRTDLAMQLYAKNATSN